MSNGNGKNTLKMAFKEAFPDNTLNMSFEEAMGRIEDLEIENFKLVEEKVEDKKYMEYQRGMLRELEKEIRKLKKNIKE